jgi:hypothetical protein
MGSSWLPGQAHMGLLRGFVCLLKVAPSATCDEVIPRVRTTGPLGNDMINSEILSFDPAVLAGELVTGEDRVARKP